MTLTIRNLKATLLAACLACTMLSTAQPNQDMRRKFGANFELKLPRQGGSITMIWCPPGTFTMGSPQQESGRNADENEHRVTLTRGFWLSKTEITQAQWRAVKGLTKKQQLKSKPRFGELAGLGDKHPIYNITFWEARHFCNLINKQERQNGRLPKGYIYNLPTEAQWEYACRAGTKTALNNGTDLTDKLKCPNLDKVAWFRGNSGAANTPGSTHETARKQPNPWGFHDMHGNVAEWCLDKADFDSLTGTVTTVSTYRKPEEVNPQTWRGKENVYRGGAWTSPSTFCRAASRRCQAPNTKGTHVGMRLALIPGK